MLQLSKYLFCSFILLFYWSCSSSESAAPSDTKTVEVVPEKISAPAKLDMAQASRLATLPMKCMEQEFPNKLGQILGDANDLKTPKELHPAFYGCFDWHSAVHGHWMLTALLKNYPAIENANLIKAKLLENISKENILKEIDYFNGKMNKSYERTYGWAWLLKLQLELDTWDGAEGKKMAANLKPLSDLIAERYIDFLPRLNYPIRVGEHTNSGFGLTFAWDYAKQSGDTELLNIIKSRAQAFFKEDQGCPLSWEPSGYDFLSPCLEEVDIMKRVLSKEEFLPWLKAFLPQLFDANFELKPAEVSDRKDGKLVHLDGLNFSRAWVLGALVNDYPELGHLKKIADDHLAFSLPNVVGDDYEGGHWLASFAMYALLNN